MYDNTWVRGQKELNTLRFLKKISDLQGTQEKVRVSAVFRLGCNIEVMQHHIRVLADKKFIKVGKLVEDPQSCDDMGCVVTDEGAAIIGYPLSVMEMLAIER